MINKICFSLFTLCMFIAIPLALAGFERVELGQDFLMFMSKCSIELDSYKIAIPEIPMIGSLDTNGDFWLNIVNGLINFVNFISRILNVLTTILNVIIQVLEFIIIVVKNLIALANNAENISTFDSYWSDWHSFNLVASF